MEMPPRAPFPRKSDGKMLKREVAMVVVVVVLVMVDMRRESIVAGGSVGELECEILQCKMREIPCFFKVLQNFYQIYNFLALSSF